MSKKVSHDNSSYAKRRKIISIVSIVVIFIITALLTLFVWKWLASFSSEGFREYIQSFGALSWLVLLGLQVLQVFVALIPGELLESAAGFAFGPVTGTVICYAGVAIGSAIIFFLTRRFGIKLVEVFVSTDKINELKFMNTETKRNNLIFLMFFIPGTPKDLLTYFVGLTKIRFSVFITISLVARFPSVISSTFGGHLLGEGQYIGAVLLYSVTAVVSLAGLYYYNRVLKKHNEADINKESGQ